MDLYSRRGTEKKIKIRKGSYNLNEGRRNRRESKTENGMRKRWESNMERGICDGW